MDVSGEAILLSKKNRRILITHYDILKISLNKKYSPKGGDELGKKRLCPDDISKK